MTTDDVSLQTSGENGFNHPSLARGKVERWSMRGVVQVSAVIERSSAIGERFPGSIIVEIAPDPLHGVALGIIGRVLVHGVAGLSEAHWYPSARQAGSQGM